MASCDEFDLNDDVISNALYNFAMNWSQKKNQDGEFVFPSIKDIIDGLYAYQSQQIEEKLQSLPKIWIENYKKKERLLFDFFIRCFGKKETSTPLTNEVLEDPCSTETQILCFLYCMEPSLYKDIQ